MGYKETDEVVVQIGSHEVCAGWFFTHITNQSGQTGERKERKTKTEGCVADAWIEEKLTPPGHPKGLPSPMHLGGGTIVVGDGV